MVDLIEDRRPRWILAALLFGAILLAPSQGRMEYDIVATVGPSGWEIHRLINNINFTLDGSVGGKGNFSQFTDIKGFAGISMKERSSSSHTGNVNYEEQMTLIGREGPLVVTTKTKSSTVKTENENVSPLNINEYADIDIDEIWFTYFADYKKIAYNGPNIRDYEKYENNRDVIASSIISHELSKESLYRASINRTIISVNITPQGVTEDRSQNKSSSYLLNLKSVGSLAHFDIIKQGSPSNSAYISEDFVGQDNVNLKVNMGSVVHPPDPNAITSWLPCCAGGYFDMSDSDRRSSSWDSIFDCMGLDSSICSTSGPVGRTGQIGIWPA